MTTRRIVITIPIVTGSGSPNPKLCDVACPCFESEAGCSLCKAFPTRNGQYRDLKVTDPDGYPTRCQQCRKAEVK